MERERGSEVRNLNPEEIGISDAELAQLRKNNFITLRLGKREDLAVGQIIKLLTVETAINARGGRVPVLDESESVKITEIKESSDRSKPYDQIEVTFELVKEK